MTTSDEPTAGEAKPQSMSQPSLTESILNEMRPMVNILGWISSRSTPRISTGHRRGRYHYTFNETNTFSSQAKSGSSQALELRVDWIE